MRTCLSCRARLREFRAAPERVAALVPPAALVASDGGGPLRASGRVAGRGQRALPRSGRARHGPEDCGGGGVGCRACRRRHGDRRVREPPGSAAARAGATGRGGPGEGRDRGGAGARRRSRRPRPRPRQTPHPRRRPQQSPNRRHPIRRPSSHPAAPSPSPPRQRRPATGAEQLRPGRQRHQRAGPPAAAASSRPSGERTFSTPSHRIGPGYLASRAPGPGRGDTLTPMTRRVAAITAAAALSLGAAPALAKDHDHGKLRFATFNASVNRNADGQLLQELSNGDDPQLRNVAEIIQRVRPDVLLVNEFDFVPDQQAARLFQRNYLSVPQNGARAIEFRYRFVAPSNTGIASGQGPRQRRSDRDPAGLRRLRQRLVRLRRVPGQVRHGRLLARADRLQARPDLPALPLEGHARSAAAGRSRPRRRPRTGTRRTSSTCSASRRRAIGTSRSKLDGGRRVHFLVSHPTPPVFDGPEDRNGKRNHDEIRFWADYVTPGAGGYIYDDDGRRGGLRRGEHFVIAGDQNADPFDGDGVDHAIRQLLDNPRVNASVTPTSPGGPQQSQLQGGANTTHQGNPAVRHGGLRRRRTGQPARRLRAARPRHQDPEQLRVLAAEQRPAVPPGRHVQRRAAARRERLPVIRPPARGSGRGRAQGAWPRRPPPRARQAPLAPRFRADPRQPAGGRRARLHVERARVGVRLRGS